MFNYSQEFLLEYENKWKQTFGRKIKRNYLVKELLLDMDDKTLNRLAHTLKDVKFDEISTHGLVKEVAKHLPISTKLKALVKHGEKIREIKKQ
jgi:digeranylgeranylglycerophospholipid reductase